MSAPRRIQAQLTTTAIFRLLMALAAALFITGFVLHIPARMIVEAAPCAVAMLILQTASGDGCRLAAGIGLVWVLTMAGILVSPWLPVVAQHLGPLCTIHPIAAGIMALLAALICWIGLAAPTDHHNATRVLFFLLGIVGEIVIIELTLSPYFSVRI